MSPRYKYVEGVKVGPFEVVSRDGPEEIVVRCTCGTVRTLTPSMISRLKSCGCMKRGRRPGVETLAVVGRTFGQVTVVAVSQSEDGRLRAQVRCTRCGAERDVARNALYGFRGSGGCRRDCRPLAKGPNGHPLAAQWHTAKRSGHLGQEWAGDFWAFAVEVGFPPGPRLTLSRPNKRQPMGPDNWEWVPRNRIGLVEVGGVRLSLSGWARRLGMSRQAVHARIKKMPLAEALAKPRSSDRQVSVQVGHEAAVGA